MKIISVMNAHGEPDLLADTVDSIRTYLGQDILVCIDGARRDRLAGADLPACHYIEGLLHGAPRSPYRNTALALKTAYQTWPDADWYCYIECDVLVGSSLIVGMLERSPKDVWCVGPDLRNQNQDWGLGLLGSVVKSCLPTCKYMLGCCVFYRREFLAKLAEIDFFDRLLFYTNGFGDGYFPGYRGWDVSEHMYPTLAAHFGGHCYGLAAYDERRDDWIGDYAHFPMRWRPELDVTRDPYLDGCLMHPLKQIDNPIRVYHRLKREEGKCSTR
jgi:hypothetical protein